MTSSNSNGVISIRSAHSFAETVERLLSAFASHSIKTFATIDQCAEAAAVGLALPPTTLIVFGNPKAGTPLMAKQPLSALDLPLKVLVTESKPGEIVVSFNSAQYIVARHSLPPEMANNLAPAEKLVAGAVAG